MKRFLTAAFTWLIVNAICHAQGKEAVLANYTKYEYRIAMRDGVKLFTSVYVPKDDTKQYPMLMKRTPYSIAPYGVDAYPDTLGPSAIFAKEGYFFVYQDVRGRWNSEGEYVNVRPHIPKKHAKEIDESTDTYDTIEWLLKNVPNHNGKVGTWGISYPGFYVAAGMIDAHPALKACSPQAPVTDWFIGDDFHHNGVLFLPHCFNFMANFGRPRPTPITKSQYLRFDHNNVDGYDFFLNMGSLYNADKNYFKGDIAFWKEVMSHGTYDDFWKQKNIRQHLKSIKPAVMTVGGWFDAENLFGALETYKNTERMSPDHPANIIVMGPWDHGGWSRDDADRLGPVKFNAKTGPYYREQIELPFFEYHLKGKGSGKFPEAMMFETGTNVWRKHEAWPPKNAVKQAFYFGSRQQLLTQSEAEREHDEFISDPAKPVPYIEKTNIGMDKEYMIADQRFASRRPDVLVYQTPVLENDLTLSGPIDVNLTVSTTGTDADWIVKVIDVYPPEFPEWEPNPTGVKMGNFQQLIRAEPFRGKFRNSFEKPEPFVPGKPTTIKFTLPDVCHTLRPGHRLMIHVQSSWFPLTDRNPQKFTDIYNAQDSDFVKQTHRVYRGDGQTSAVTFTVVKK